MSELITRTARLVPYAKRPKQVPSFVTAFLHEPLPDDPGFEMGSFYVVLEVLISGRASEEVADIIIATVGDIYYNHAAEYEDALSRFEAAVRATNTELAEHVNRGNASWIGKLSAVIAMQDGAELHVASTGSAEAFLYRGHSSTRVTAGASTKPAAPSKTFGTIATGQLEAGDRVLLATPALVHQVPLAKLQSVISQASPNGAIAELTELLGKPSETERIAALIIEVTTPELAAMQVRSEQPSEVQLGTPETPLEAAKLAATPLAHSTVRGGKKLAGAAHQAIKHAQPRARKLGLALAGQMRNLLSTTKGRRTALAALILIVACVGIFAWLGSKSTHSAAALDEYQQAYSDFTKAQSQLQSGKKPEAQSSFIAVQKQLAGLSADESAINAKLARMTLPEGEPKTYSAFTSLLSDRIDQLEGIVRASPTTVSAFARGAHPVHFEIAGGKAYVFDSAATSKISIVDLENGAATPSSTQSGNLGGIVATTLSQDGQSIYILTNKPDVWLYRIASDSLVEQNSAGGWPASAGIASYASNLYLLTSDSIYKFARQGSGFGPKSLYMGLEDSATGASSIAVDGSVYLATPSHLQRYLLGVLKDQAQMPPELAGMTGLRAENGQVVTGLSTKTMRIGLWNIAKGLGPSKQIVVAGVKTLNDSVYDQQTGVLYALADNRLVRFAVEP